MKARIRISLNSASVCTNASSCARLSSITSPGSLTRSLAIDGRPEIKLASPVKLPGPWLTMSVSAPSETCSA